MKVRDIEKINISENSPYSIDEEWITTDEEGFFDSGTIDNKQKIYLLKQKLNEVIELLNNLKNEMWLPRNRTERRRILLCR